MSMFFNNFFYQIQLNIKISYFFQLMSLENFLKQMCKRYDRVFDALFLLMKLRMRKINKNFSIKLLEFLIIIMQKLLLLWETCI